MNWELKKLYEETLLSKTVFNEYKEDGYYCSSYFEKPINLLAAALGNSPKEMTGSKCGLTTYVERHPGIWEKVGAEALDLLSGAYKISQDMGIAKDIPSENTETVEGKTIIHRSFLQKAYETTFSEDYVMSEEDDDTDYDNMKWSDTELLMVREMVWNLIAAALGEI